MDTQNILSENTTTYNGAQGRILELLGTGLSPEIVASAAGVTPSYISQLLSEPSFSAQVTQLRFNNLQSATNRDRKYDDIEDALIAKMQDLLPMMYKPLEVLRAITVINGAKRRGASAPETIHMNNTVVNLVIPTQILQKFTVNSANQVVEVFSSSNGDSDIDKSKNIKETTGQTLVTMPSSTLLKKFTSTEKSHDSISQGQISFSSS